MTEQRGVYMKKIELSLANAWVRQHRGDETLPAAAVEEFVLAHFGDRVKIDSNSITALTVTITDDELSLEEFQNDLEVR